MLLFFFFFNACQNCSFSLFLLFLLFFFCSIFFFFFFFFSHPLFSLSLSLSLSLSPSLFRYPHIAGTRYYDTSAAYPLPSSDTAKSEDALPPPLLPLCVSLSLLFFIFFLKFPHPFSRLYFLSLSLFSLLSSLFSLSGLMLISPCSSVACVLVMFFVFYV